MGITVVKVQQLSFPLCLNKYSHGHSGRNRGKFRSIPAVYSFAQGQDSSKIGQRTVTLDGEEIEMPASIVPANLTPREHVVKIIATDEGNNIATKEVNFIAASTGASSLTAGQNGITTNAASLFVNVGSASSDGTLLQGKSLTMQNGGITVKSNENGTSSTLNLSGDHSVTVSAPDGNFPYKLFTVNTGTVGGKRTMLRFTGKEKPAIPMRSILLLCTC